ncbi:hypothetical protein LPN04_31020 [Rugamonas sp. A1-17]|nr:hypothetical protein [Rugamonas sp. A1-17]
MHGGSLDEIIALNIGGDNEARLLASDLDMLVKLADLAGIAAKAINEHKASDFNSDHPDLSAFIRKYEESTAQ